MDPLTQGTLGAALPQAATGARRAAAAGGVGFVAGTLADLDVLIRSDTDPLLFLEYHRQFTHALVFVPVGGLIAAAVLWLIAGRRWGAGFGWLFLFATLGYGTHGLLDAATSYGTMLLWPFSDVRVSWSIVSVVDPLFTLPLLAGVAAAMWKRRPRYARLGLAWAALYLTLGWTQHQAALAMAEDLAAGRGHTPVRVQVKPSLGNLIVWKTVYETADRYYVDAVRPFPDGRVYAGASLPVLDAARAFPWLTEGSRQARDLERFRWFSDGFVARSDEHPNRVIDVRYSMVPNRIEGLWAIELDQDAPPDAHVRYLTDRDDPRAAAHILWDMIFGD